MHEWIIFNGMKAALKVDESPCELIFSHFHRIINGLKRPAHSHDLTGCTCLKPPPALLTKSYSNTPSAAIWFDVITIRSLLLSSLQYNCAVLFTGKWIVNGSTTQQRKSHGYGRTLCQTLLSSPNYGTRQGTTVASVKQRLKPSGQTKMPLLLKWNPSLVRPKMHHMMIPYSESGAIVDSTCRNINTGKLQDVRSNPGLHGSFGETRSLRKFSGRFELSAPRTRFLLFTLRLALVLQIVKASTI